MNILLIEDDPSAARLVRILLAAEGCETAIADTGEEGMALAETYAYDAILLDLGLADISGAEVLRRLRARKIDTPVIVLTGSADVGAKVGALSSGADDYVVKPYHKDELSARIRAVVRRSRGHGESILQTGPIAVNLNTRTVEVSGRPVRLTPSEYKLLELFSLRKNQVLTKEACLSHLYNGLAEPEIKIIDVFVCKLRKKIAAASDGDGCIETVWGGGYMLRDVKADPAGPPASRSGSYRPVVMA